MKFFACLILILGLVQLKSNKTKRLDEKVVEANAYVLSNKMNERYIVLVDMQIHSGKKRMFVWDNHANKIVLNGMCAHGACRNEWRTDQSKTTPVFSNVPDSHCSSLGRYRIGARGWSNFGIHVNYKLHGLDSSNSNAYKRFIVLHSWDYMTDDEIYPNGSSESWGCPAVSNNFMRQLDSLLRKEKDVLLWIFRD